jgi:outer membrane protein, heavy metal efflux system
MLGLYQTVRQRWLLIPLLLAWPLTSFAQNRTDCEPPESVNSAVLVQLSLECNAQLSVTSYQWQAEEELVSAAGALDDPMLSYSLAPDTLSESQDRGETIELSQTLPWPGKRRLRREAAEARADAWQYQWQDAQVRLAREVRYGYADWATVHALLAINTRHRELWRDFITIAETKYATGQENKHAVLQANTQLQHLQHRAVQLETKREVIEAALNRFLNRPPEADFGQPVALNLPALSTGLIPPALIAQHLAALESQPLFQQLRAQRQAVAAEAALADKDRYPDFTLMAQRNTMWINPDHQNMVGIAINIPFDFGKRSGRIGSLNAQENALRWQERELTNQLREHISNARVRWQEARHILALHENELLPLARETLASAHSEYQSGAGDFLSLLTAEQFLLTTQQNYENARRDVVRRHADLIASLGLISTADASLELPLQE